MCFDPVRGAYVFRLLACLTLTFGLTLAAPGMAETSQASLARKIETLGANFDKDGRVSVVLEGCLYQGMRWQSVAGGPEIVTGIASVDLRTAKIMFPEPFRVANELFVKEGKEPRFRSEGTAVAFSGEGDKIHGTFDFVGSKAHPIVREEHISRDNAQVAIRKRKARPSPRGDGKSYIFRDSVTLAISREGPKKVAQLRELEQALQQYQTAFCDRLSS